MKTLHWVALAFTASFSTALAQTSTPTPAPTAQGVIAVAEGVSGDVDASRRGPVLTVSTNWVEEPAHMQILADAYLPNRQFIKYPIRFDFFIERKLFASQIRAVEAFGPVGVDVGPDIASPPFTFSVVATVLHPNRQYITVHHGSTVAVPDARVLDCTVTWSATGNLDDAQTFIGNDVKPEAGDKSVTMNFEAKNEDGSASASTEVVIDAAPNPAQTNGDIVAADVTASVSVTQGTDKRTQTMRGEAVFRGPTLESLSVSADDDASSLECS